MPVVIMLIVTVLLLYCYVILDICSSLYFEFYFNVVLANLCN